MLGNVEHVHEVIFNRVHWPEERVTFLVYLEGFLTVRRLHLCFSKGALCLRDNRNQQIEHENNEDEADQEVDDPVNVAKMTVLLIVNVFTKTPAEGDLPRIHPVVKVLTK